MNECINFLDKTTVFYTLDVNSGYWRIKIKDVNKHKTVLTLHYCLYLFMQMPFGLQNAVDTFQRTSSMHVILFSVTWKFALIYVNIIMLFSNTSETYIDYVCKVLLLLYNAGTTLNARGEPSSPIQLIILITSANIFVLNVQNLRHTQRMLSVDFSHQPVSSN